MSDKHQRLVTLLLRNTQRGELAWEEGLDDNFQVSFSTSSIRIRQAKVSDRNVIAIDLINEDGGVVDSFDDEDLDFVTNGSGIGHWYSKMTELFELVRRTARGAEKVLNEVLGELTKDDLPF